MELELEGKVAIVTGASRGLGLEIVRAFAAEGMKILAAARSTDDLEKLAAEAGTETVQPARCDVSDRGQVQSLVDTAVGAFGRVDVVVNNAGIAPASPFADMPLAQWEDVFAVNLFAPVALCRAAAPRFIAQKSGKVINIASTSGLRGKPTLAAYSSSKGAMLRFTEALAGEWARHNIQVNAIAPGAFETDAQRAVLEDPDILGRRLRKIPAGRMGRPSEIGPLTCFLASAASDFVTGSVYTIDGGESSKL